MQLNSLKHNFQRTSKPLIYTSNTRLPIGCIEGSTLKKRGVVYQRLNAYAIETSAMYELRQHDVKWIEITDKNSLQLYTIALEDFLKYAKPIDEGWGKQLACPRTYFKVSGYEQLNLLDTHCVA